MATWNGCRCASRSATTASTRQYRYRSTTFRRAEDDRGYYYYPYSGFGYYGYPYYGAWGASPYVGFGATYGYWW